MKCVDAREALFAHLHLKRMSIISTLLAFQRNDIKWHMMKKSSFMSSDFVYTAEKTSDNFVFVKIQNDFLILQMSSLLSIILCLAINTTNLKWSQQQLRWHATKANRKTVFDCFVCHGQREWDTSGEQSASMTFSIRLLHNLCVAVHLFWIIFNLSVVVVVVVFISSLFRKKITDDYQSKHSDHDSKQNLFVISTLNFFFALFSIRSDFLYKFIGFFKFYYVVAKQSHLINIFFSNLYHQIHYAVCANKSAHQKQKYQREKSNKNTSLVNAIFGQQFFFASILVQITIYRSQSKTKRKFIAWSPMKKTLNYK